MASMLKIPRMLGGDKPAVALAGAGAATDIDMPTTQVRMAEDTYDPVSHVSMMDRVRETDAGTAGSPTLPGIGHLPMAKQLQWLLALMFTFFAVAGVMLWLDSRATAQRGGASATATEMQMLSQRLARSTALAAQGQASAFAAVKDSHDRFRTDFEALTNGGPSKGVNLDAPRDETVIKLLGDVKTRWERVDANVVKVLDNQQALRTLATGLASINQGNNALLDLAQQVTQQVGQANGSFREVDHANQLAVLSQRIAKNANTLASSEDIDADVAFLLARDTASFRDIANGLLKGSDSLRLSAVRNEDARMALGDLQRRFASYETGVNAILQNMSRLLTAKQAARAVNEDSEGLLADTTKLAEQFEGGARIGAWGALVFGLVGLAFLGLLGKVSRDDARSRAFTSEQENKRNQEAILRLLNEMGNLADGDLTVQASVTEDVTGAIADSINFTIEELRTLVRGINSATDEVTRATQEAQSISTRLYEASQRQNREIQQASASVLQMAESISEVSASAGQSARVAQQSLAAAEMGAQSVQNQISGMNEIRTQIQDTSKRIKRLGESSLEIGEIVELISDITEQTNVLALNAAIQAASAGEAGRGFTVVAEEVQRLAERSAEATKQIEAIVKTIQADTQDAVAAMEKSTVGVVEGTKLSDAAGQALDEIGKVSRDLAALIEGISEQTQKQTASVTDVTRGMQGILRISEETTEGTKQTNVSIGQLTKLAAELRSSVAGFKV
ncbi:MAG: methyl-accepting chemotaxis protein [Pseudomonadota bacterium]|nr:methyl-accepting chemotaxis protein [Pseudomonadota bacterium]